MNDTMAGPQVLDAWVAAFAKADPDALVACYASDVVLDVNVPQWRFQVQGRSGARDLVVEEEFLPGRRVTHVTRTPTVDGELVEIECRAPIEGRECLWRSLHVLRCRGGLVSEHVIYCSGIWDPASIERQQVEAPMVRAW